MVIAGEEDQKAERFPSVIATASRKMEFLLQMRSLRLKRLSPNVLRFDP
jgi:hypothetical protein